MQWIIKSKPKIWHLQDVLVGSETHHSQQTATKPSLINMNNGKTRVNSYQQKVQQQPIYKDIGYHFKLKSRSQVLK